MIVYIRDHKTYFGELLNLINTFSQVDDTKINSQKSGALKYMNDKWTEKEIRETTPFPIA